jgi:hypothetical protein
MHYLSTMISKQDELLMSNIDKKYRVFAKRLLTRYASDHPFYTIAKQYRDDFKKLKEEIDKALIEREVYVRFILNEFRSIK